MNVKKNAPMERYGWRLAALMGEHKIRTGADLQRKLADVGYEITSSQVARIIYNRPRQVKTALLDALGEIFGCTLDDLMPLLDPAGREVEQRAPAPKERKKRVRAPKATPSSDMREEDLAGPVVHPFPLPKK